MTCMNKQEKTYSLRFYTAAAGGLSLVGVSVVGVSSSFLAVFGFVSLLAFLAF